MVITSEIAINPIHTSLKVLLKMLNYIRYKHKALYFRIWDAVVRNIGYYWLPVDNEMIADI